MKINKEILIPSINIILMITLIALAASCTTTQDIVHSHTIKYPCPTFKDK